MKKLWSVCIVLALVASAAFASYKKEDLKAQTSGGEQISIEKLVGRYELGEQLSELEKAMLTDYFAANPGRNESNPMDAQGGPDVFGYRWVDNQGGDSVVYNWIELCNDALATAVATSGDDVTTLVPFGLTFPYYGTNYTQGWASSNGMLSLSASNNAWTNLAISATNTNSAIYVYWDDMLQTAATIGQCDVNGKMFYRNFGDYTVIEWKRFDPFGTATGLTSVEAIIWNTGMIKIQWNTPDYTHNSSSATIGIEAPLGDGLQYMFNTAGIAGGWAVVFYPPQTAPSGRCCYVDGGAGTCREFTADECALLGGQWGGSGTTCDSSPCPVGRCCYNGGAACADVIQVECNFLGGQWTAGMTCAANPCPVILNGSDLCQDAVALGLNTPVQGNNSLATPELGIPACGSGYNATAKGVWYKVMGTGNTMTVGMCDPATTFDTELFVFCGTCDALTCIGGDDDGCVTPGLASTVTWCSSFGTEYLVLATAFGSGTGDFAILVTDDGLPCTGAINCSPLGRCCYADALGPQCADVTAEECLILGGEFDALSTCAAGSCAGSCCYLVDNAGFCHDEAVCVDNVLASACATLGGAWYQGLTCAETPCQAFVPCVCNCSVYPNSHATVAADETIYPIISNTPATCMTVNVPIEYQITDLNVCVDLVHTYDSDISISITSPMGTTVVLSAFNGSFGDNYLCTEFDDEALNPVSGGAAPFSGSWIPDNALSAFDGENAVGDWLLCVDDQVGGDDGFIIGTCLKFEYDQILPVAFGSFDAIAGDRSVTLNWNTSSESHLDRYEIVRDGAVVANVSAQNSATGANYTYTDENLTNGTPYSYSLVVVDVNGARATLATQSATPSAAATVTEYALHQNYPNPFNPTTNIVFDMVEAGRVTVSVFNIMGQKVAELVNGNVEAGRHTVSFDATGLSSGLYLYKMEANGFTAQSKMILMK